jgi:hypothetical protein
MDQLLESVKYAIPVITLVIGWLLNQWADSHKAHRDDRRKLKKTLFYLLEIRHQFRLHIPDEAQINYYLKIVKEKFSSVAEIQNMPDEIFSNQMRPFINKGLNANRNVINDADIKMLSDNFVKCIDNLAEVDPLLAFRLHGKQHAQRVFAEALTNTKSVMSEIARDEQTIEVNKAFDSIEPKLLVEAATDLESVIIELSKKIGRRTHKATLKKLSPKFTPKEQADAENLLTTLLNSALVAQQQ